MAQGKAMTAAEAVKCFSKSSIQVMVAKRVTVRDKETGKAREAVKAEQVPLAAEHILAATDFGARVVITTTDGKKYEASK